MRWKKAYKGVSGYIYCAKDIVEADFDTQIPYAAVSSSSVEIDSVEYVPDAYETIIQAEKAGLLLY